VRRLLPTPADEVDVDAAYAVAADVPFHVRANMVASLDGAATEHGRSGGLSGAADKELFKVLRDHADAVLVGAGTVRVEGYRPPKPSPERRARRTAHGLGEVPRIVVVSGRLDLDPDAPLFTDNDVRPLVLTTSSAPPAERRRLEHVADVVDAGETRVDLADGLRAISAAGARRVLCEGGPHLLGQVVATGWLDELCLTLSPTVVGGDAMRILAGATLAPPVSARLAHVLEDDGFLFLRYATR
jgi:riboflavin biosynthesis pyrimidine reductase